MKQHIAIIGGRDFKDYNSLKTFIFSKINELELSNYIIVSGGARGADTLAEHFAKEYNLEIKIFKAEWEKFGKTAGMIRNVDIINSAEIVFAFWDGKSKGTQNGIKLAEKFNKELYIFKYKKVEPEKLNFNEIKQRIKNLWN